MFVVGGMLGSVGPAVSLCGGDLGAVAQVSTAPSGDHSPHRPPGVQGAGTLGFFKAPGVLSENLGPRLSVRTHD